MRVLSFILHCFFLLILSSPVFCGSNKINIQTVSSVQPEYALFRVEYTIRKTGFETKIFWDNGTSKTHSLANIVQPVEGDGLRITKKDGSIIVVHSEIDLLNCLSEYGWKLKETYTIKIMSNEYQTYILIKE